LYASRLKRIKRKKAGEPLDDLSVAGEPSDVLLSFVLLMLITLLS